ncbi:MAG: 30S ribosomal protein S6 [Deltaproteobacteria bacterium]|nr:30S ribosomal protein S6 [Deltaproteobacteria bacterium]
MDRHYETVFIINPDAGEEATKGIVKKAAALVEKHEGKEIKVEEWGRRRLAYPVEKKKEGYYVLFTYSSSAEASKELERMFRNNEAVMRYQTVAVKKRPAAPVTAEKAAAEGKGVENEQ